MKYLVNIDGRQFPVSLINPPKDLTKLDAFEQTEDGSALIGTPDLFVNLKKEGSRYKAFSVKTSTPKIEVDVEKIIADNKRKSEPEPVVVIEEPEPIAEEEVEEPEEEEFVPQTIQISIPETTYKDLYPDHKTESLESVIERNSEHAKGMIFCPVFKESETYILYQKEKTIWIKRFGSEKLNLAHDMHMKCDKGYVIERASREFPTFEIDVEFECIEVDTPDVSILRFLKNEAFSQEQNKSISQYGSRIVIASNDEEEEDPFVVIKNYLGLCDLITKVRTLVEESAVAGRL